VKSLILLQFNVSSIYLSTDDPLVLHQTALYPAFRWYWMQLPRMNVSAERRSLFLGKDGLFIEGAAAISDILIALHADFFCGTMGSNFSMLINGLRKVNGKVHTPYITPVRLSTAA
jgi:hypothetical protein